MMSGVEPTCDERQDDGDCEKVVRAKTTTMMMNTGRRRDDRTSGPHRIITRRRCQHHRAAAAAAAIRQAEYRRLKAIVPNVADKKSVSKVYTALCCIDSGDNRDIHT